MSTGSGLHSELLQAAVVSLSLWEVVELRELQNYLGSLKDNAEDPQMQHL